MNIKYRQSVLLNYFKDPILSKNVIISRTKVSIQPHVLQHISSIPEDELIKLVICILERKRTDDRTMMDLQVMIAALRPFPFFDRLNEVADLPENQMIEYCKYLEIDVAMEGQFVFHKGDRGDKFYIILHGRVEILVPEEQIVEDNGKMKMQTVLKRINEIGKKGFFGELALMNDAPRIASVRCLESCYFGVLDRKSFKNIISQSRTAQINQKTLFFKSIQLFSKLTKRSIHTLIYHFELQSLQMNQILYREDDVADKIFIVKAGEIKLTKLIEIKRQQEAVNNVMKQNKIMRHIQFTTMSVGEIFGELDCLLGEKRHFTATAQRVGSSVYVISKEAFVKRVLENMNKEVKVFIDKYVKEKMDYGNSRMKQILSTLEENQNLVYGKYQSKEKIVKPSSAQTPTNHQRSKTESEMKSPEKMRSQQQQYYSSKSQTEDELQFQQQQINLQLDHLGQFAQRCKLRSQSTQKKKKQNSQKIYDEFIIPDDIKRRYYKKLLKLKISENFAQMKRAQYKITTNQTSSSIEVKDSLVRNNPNSSSKQPNNLSNVESSIRHVQDYVDTHMNYRTRMIRALSAAEQKISSSYSRSRTAHQTIHNLSYIQKTQQSPQGTEANTVLLSVKKMLQF